MAPVDECHTLKQSSESKKSFVIVVGAMKHLKYMDRSAKQKQDQGRASMEARTREDLFFPCPQNAFSMETTLHAPDSRHCGRHFPRLNESAVESSGIYVLRQGGPDTYELDLR